MPLSKTDKLRTKERVAVVQRLLVEGHSTPVIVQNISKKWDIGERQAYNYVSKAWDTFAEKYENRRDAILGFHVAARLNLFRKAYDAEQYYVCKQILEDLAKLQGLYVNKVAFTDPEGKIDYGALTADELVRRLLAVLNIDNVDGNEIKANVVKIMEAE